MPLRARARPASRPSSGWVAVPALIIGIVLAGCAAPVPSPQALNDSYTSALSRTQPLAVTLDVATPDGQAAWARLAGYFAAMTEDSVATGTALVYAPQAYLNDTLVAIDGEAEIRRYFAATAQRARRVEVVFVDHATSGIEHYVRWVMTIEADGFAGGQPVQSHGLTHFRFDARGRVLLHKDFWDSGTGFHEHLPVIGSLLRRVRATVHEG